jgi:hypothetical protein
MLCSECTQSVYESTETDSLDSSGACVEISTRYSWICLRYAFGVDMRLQGYADVD